MSNKMERRKIIMGGGLVAAFAGLMLPRKASAQLGASTSAFPTSSVDTTVDTTIVFTGQCSNAADTITLESYQIEVMKLP